ncbi:MAG: hypothetical protein AB4911_23530 [Oscillochloridaceae bacterium umkhey_bin13]
MWIEFIQLALALVLGWLGWICMQVARPSPVRTTRSVRAQAPRSVVKRQATEGEG